MLLGSTSSPSSAPILPSPDPDRPLGATLQGTPKHPLPQIPYLRDKGRDELLMLRCELLHDMYEAFQTGLQDRGDNSQSPSMLPQSLKPPKHLHCGPLFGQSRTALESSPSWQVRKLSAESPAESSSSHPGGSARSGPQGPGDWHIPPPALGRPSSVLHGPCSGWAHME